ncbi:MAG: ribosome-associated translation inhibitor RaiA [Clostridia bacterium]|nr:ribosome-associated translation inhibitor RaiA [Clostridia bacterium]
MRIEFVERNYDIGNKLKTLIQKKIDKLDRYLDDEAKARVICSLQKNIYKMEITVSYKTRFFRAEVVGENMYDDIDVVLPKIERQIIKYSKKYKEIFKKSAFDSVKFEFLDELPEDKEKQIYKIKEFELSPMSIEEAIENMQMLEHSFYIFLNEKSNKVNVLYNRRDGELGVIECNY